MNCQLNKSQVFIGINWGIALISMICYFIFKSADVLQWGSQKVIFQWLFKGIPLICFILNGFILLHLYNGLKNRTRIFALVGAFCGLTADYILIIKGDTAFYIGLLIFLLGHLFYIISTSIPPTKEDPFVPLHLLRLLPCVLVFVPVIIWLIVKILSTSTSSTTVKIITTIAISIYGLREIGVIWRVLSRIQYTPLHFYEPLWAQIVCTVGLLLFVISDGILGCELFGGFGGTEIMWDLMVLIPYWIGQGLFQYGVMVGQPVERSDEEPLKEENGDSHKYVTL